MKTKDFGLAALFVAKKCALLAYEMDSMSQMWFTFNDDKTVRELEQSFHCNAATVHAQDYLAAQKMLKALIYDNRRTNYEHKLGRVDYSITR
ncbi:hypothetical protein HZB60_12365 [candidate division KSB1 bacterium]|nr:hypothetical protein [candidate division KSB1 bacterium]